MNQLLYLRRQYGEVFVTELPSGQIVPWRPLSTGEYIHYNRLLRMGVPPPAAVEDEIFIKCVQDKVLVNSIDKLKAGIVSSIVACIISYSGPQGADELNYMLNLKRAEINDAIHEIVGIICQAFPAYKPEEVYEMDYDTIMQRAALAESKLLRTGILQEPMEFQAPQREEDRRISEQERQQRLEKNKKMREEYYKQEGIHVPDKFKDTRREPPISHVPLASPLKTTERTVITKSDMIEHQAVLQGHEADEVEQIKSTNKTAQIYADYLEQMKDGGELRIKTDEERLAAAKERMEQNKQKLLERQKIAAEAARKELPELLKVREEARKRKQRKAARRRK